ncbi:DUF4365 domain-containing protein [Sphingobacterium bambusae]|uniref:DUF4365 domain-containing protein n=1 Tax=Sphingobacterium bambusae TaxID=662858 RepID=A0ABW6BCK8_9SPHI|nr:DUF4365 domain-containing protein [Sphingobacterium bambusae]WPL48545.1 DUF4365 domain-containing protein [Sphingobacterium bambusae]
MSKKRSSEEIQESGNILLDNVLEKIRVAYQDIKIIKTSEEHQKDRGVDFQIELIDKSNERTLEMFKLQVKATDEPVTALKTTENKGLISFQIDNRHIRYYQKEMPWALLFLLCENANQKVYWYAIQLDSSLERRLNQSIAQNKRSMQIFLDPKNVLEESSFNTFVNDAKKSNVAQFFRDSEQLVTTISADVDFKVDRSKPLLDQLYSLFEYLFGELLYLPKHLITQYYPFKISEFQSSFYHQFKLYTNNEELVTMIDSFKVQSDGNIDFTEPAFIRDVDEYEKKAKIIFERFSNNHIYSIIAEKSRREVPTRYFKKRKCNCIVCCYSRLEIPKVLKMLQNSRAQSLEDRMKMAYMNYMFGNYLQAAKAFEEIGVVAKKKKKETLNLITQFNLIKLGRLIRSNYYSHEELELGKKMMEINLDKAVYFAPSNSHHRKLFNYIKESRFYTDSVYEVQSAISKLRSEYQSYINGAQFVTHSYEQLLTGFAKMSSFIGGNMIIYDRFAEFSMQMTEFTEGLFIALALRETNSNVISNFNNYHIKTLIFDGDHKVIWRYFNKYHLKSISYVESDGEFFSLIANLLSNHHVVCNVYKSYPDERKDFLHERYAEIFANCFCLAAIVNMDEKQVEKIVIGIMHCFTKEDLPNFEVYVQVNNFFNLKRRQLSDEMLKKLIIFFLECRGTYREKPLELFAEELKLRNISISLSTSQYQKLFNFALGDNGELMENFNVLCSFYAISEETFKLRVKRKIEEQLNKKFDPYHYNYAVIWGVLPFEKSDLLNRFIEATYPDPSHVSFGASFYGPQANPYPKFDMLFNLCFKFELSASAITKKKMVGFGDYYDWLLDLNGFDYNKFKVSWLILNPTKFFFQYYAKSPKLKEIIEDYLQNNRDIQVERLYFDIYSKKNNNLNA